MIKSFFFLFGSSFRFGSAQWKIHFFLKRMHVAVVSTQIYTHTQKPSSFHFLYTMLSLKRILECRRARLGLTTIFKTNKNRAL